MGVSLGVGELSLRFSVSFAKCCSGSDCKKVWGGVTNSLLMSHIISEMSHNSPDIFFLSLSLFKQYNVRHFQPESVREIEL